ncbi:MAG TPA: OmpH family outer membrane protein [Fimbriimonadales bacterium]|jgi:Skp family chaperone for outer membrane proteins|nr:OmpH family outer membrane protein [Fimbriimonadales bacterium]
MDKKLGIIIVCATLAFAALALTAFQPQAMKFAVVNLADVAEKSKLGIREKKNFEDLRTKFTSLMQFMTANKVMKREDATKLVDLWRKEKPTADETKQMEAIKTQAQKDSDELRRLISLLNPTADDQTKIRSMSSLAQSTEDMLDQLDNMLGRAMQDQAAAKQADVLNKARGAVQKVGKRDGYTLVMESNVAPYGATDVTDDALKVMDSDNP